MRGQVDDGGTRERILAAARELAVEEGFRGFTMERVAERAGVSRMTIYYQFGSRRELLESLFDSLAEAGRLDRLPEILREPDPRLGLGEFIRRFCEMWATDPEGIRKLRAWRVVQAGEEALHERDEWRREGLAQLVGRIHEAYGTVPETDTGDVVDVLQVLTGFEAFDTLAARGRSVEEIVVLLQRSAARLLGLDPASLRRPE